MVQVCNRSAEITTKPEPHVLYSPLFVVFPSSIVHLSNPPYTSFLIHPVFSKN
ncbi:hypothetical protein KsCSTR_35360 [Candidatus Kuenenia stuttgartiensis]|uniref:Uncharacterized protein n=1 Tax=Kuenenia stuttgartiensis TaxID=174633 RepID=Q1Q6T2_KUEST|nr:hypothetical protein KsCSTR_35360 [Candidatus Kuenenia stuttgartiensis]CAJ73276.1 unknown protein [Candidatus Kuenenia stuttgartiensis]